MRFQLRRYLRIVLILLCMFMFVFNLYQVQLIVVRKLDEHNFSLKENATRYIKTTRASEVLWPDKHFIEDDRIINQLNFQPKRMNDADKALPLKTILLYGHWSIKSGQDIFLEKQCFVNSCKVTRDTTSSRSADALLFTHIPDTLPIRGNASQVWILYLLESPVHTPSLISYQNVFNWTATYRHDSDIVAPYEKFILYNNDVRTTSQTEDFAAGKTKLIAWFVSNCDTTNQRGKYVQELQKYVNVDIYGACGQLECPRSSDKCSDMLNKDYKFYLAFENSNCRDYITEKFFVTGIQHNVIPVVMGAAPEDYARAAPKHSYIHVDDFESPKQLAEYLHKLDRNNSLYNEYFRWKGTGKFIDTKFWCRVCAMLYDTARAPSAYKDIEKWWRGEGVCVNEKGWRRTV